MKRRSYQSKKRRGRVVVAPYTKYDKAPFQYSAAYYAWKFQITGRAKKQAQAT